MLSILFGILTACCFASGTLASSRTVRTIGPYSTIAGIMFVPLGPEVERACWEGRILTRGRFAKSMKALAAELLPNPAPVRRRRPGLTRR